MTASIFATCPIDRPRVVPGLRLRPVPELATCLVYRPRPPALHMLNLTAWLLLEILIEEPDGDPWPGFRDAVRHTGSIQRAQELMTEGLQQLAKLGLLQPAAAAARES